MALPYRLDADATAIAAAFGARAGADPWQRGEIAPGRFAPVVTAGREFIAGPRPAGARLEARIVPRLWGVPPPPGAPGAGMVLTVRNPESPFWIGNLRNSEFRCLIPATALLTRAARGAPRWLAVPGQPLFAIAGVWKDSEVPSFAMLVRAAGRGALPAILPAGVAAQQLWLHGGWDRARALLADAAGAGLREV